MTHTIPKMTEVLILSVEVCMLAVACAHPHSEHDLFIRLFLTSGGGW
jgi:hypothetical protein